MLRKTLGFVKKEVVLSAAVILAIVSCFFVTPDVEYLEYIDFRTLALLFSLMAVMAGLRAQGVFASLGRFLLSKTGNTRQVVAVLVLLCFFSSMIITNDVALITFVPFTFVVLDMLGVSTRKKLVLHTVCMQTIAANLGSMLTPIGNPQNLYLFNRSGISAAALIKLMLPYTIISMLLLCGWIFLRCRASEKMQMQFESAKFNGSRKMTAMYAALFAVCLLTVVHVLPWYLLLCIVIAAIAITNLKLLLQVDYSLLITFIGFFVFIGNLGRIPLFSNWVISMLSGKEVLVSVLASQVISNVPAALLLSGFTDKYPLLIIGTNLGGLGTLIASMASLISFRQISEKESSRKGAYFVLFTVSNVIFLAVLLLAWLVLG